MRQRERVRQRERKREKQRVKEGDGEVEIGGEYLAMSVSNTLAHSKNRREGNRKREKEE